MSPMQRLFAIGFNQYTSSDKSITLGLDLCDQK
jgi:hypothetical protein